MTIGRDLLNVPMGDMIREMAFAISDAQIKLDEGSMKVAEMMGGRQTVQTRSSLFNRNPKTSTRDTRVFFGHEFMTRSQAAALRDTIPDSATGVEKLQREMLDEAANGGSDQDEEVRIPSLVSMLELGFSPTFYQFVDTIIEVKIAIKMTESITEDESETETTEESDSEGGHRGLRQLFSGGSSSRSSTVETTQVDASYSSKYSYSAEGSSLLRTKLVPVPPPAALEERVQMMIEAERRHLAAREKD
ncbi:hypothetical protein M0534_03320 [Methylonatrum kenyense]|uniref:hypothetical protein n=1 Tax=Methylonatrum kenyense TaxID=455253 RepID=UPI0020C0561D|nr:hypothetical protein [Methylonatrum kenyense]MCK8515366.1 hypothetical protein [Methylonatrum kenyense]